MTQQKILGSLDHDNDPHDCHRVEVEHWVKMSGGETGSSNPVAEPSLKLALDLSP